MTPESNYIFLWLNLERTLDKRLKMGEGSCDETIAKKVSLQKGGRLFRKNG